jgi:hypothetical protein
VIPAGADPIDAAEVALILGAGLSKLRNRKLVDQPGFPAPLNAHRARDRVWNRADVVAYAAGRPPMPRPEPSADDLLDDTEAAQAIGVSLGTFVQQAHQLSAQPRTIAAHNLRYWRRGDLVRRHERPPGRVGKPAGAKDLTPRRKRGGPPPIAAAAAVRIEELAAYLAQLTKDGKPQPGTGELAERYDVSTQTIRRWLARIDEGPPT